jgi:hypothetical protein
MIEANGIIDMRDSEEQQAGTEDAYLAWIDDMFEPTAAPLFGSSGIRHLVFRVIRPGTHQLLLSHHRPWQTVERPIETFTAHLQIDPAPLGSGSRGLSEAQQPLTAVAA